jgi:acetylornithine deacetylase/succinyl-diaminopimelate desuccinylase-like protein
MVVSARAAQTGPRHCPGAARSRTLRGVIPDTAVATDELRSAVAELMPQARRDLVELVGFRSVADPQQYPPEECEKAAQWVVGAFTEAGLQDVAASPTLGGSKAVHGSAPGPEGSPTVLLYCHYDVQPPLGEERWRTPVWELTERDGRWYGRGAADCKGNIVMHLTALRALTAARGGLPCSVKLICDGSEEQGTGGLEAFVPQNPDLLRADAILVADGGNFAAGVPTVMTTLRGMTSVNVTVWALKSAMHSETFGGPTPDATIGLVRMLASLHDERGNTTVDGLDAMQAWDGVEYPESQFRLDANVLEEVRLMGDGSVADLLWARPSATFAGMDVAPVVRPASTIQASAAARISLRLPPGMTGIQAQDALVRHLLARVPWGMRCRIDRIATSDPFVGSLEGPAVGAMRSAMEEAFGRPAITEGQGASMQLCNVLADAYPDAEIVLLGVEEPRCLIHAPNESVDPWEIERMALAEAAFLTRYGAHRAG